MRQRPFKTGLIFASWAMLLIFGCHKTRPPVPQEPPAPTIAQQSEQPQPQPTPSPTPTTEPQQATNTKPEEKPTPAHHPRPHPPVKKTPANGEKPAASGTEKPATGTSNEKPQEAKNIPPKVIIQEGGTNSSTPQVSSGQKENSGNQPTTEQLLESAENNLRNLKRDLNDNEKSTVNQIRDYITQSRQATKDADLVRAHTLALKARLLSDELVKSK